MLKKTKKVFMLLMIVLMAFTGCSKTENRQTADKSEYIGSNIETEYFYMTVPTSWNNLYSYSWRETDEYGDIDLNVAMISENELSEADIFTFYVMSIKDTENIEIALEGWVEPVAVLYDTNEDKYLLGYRLASEMTCTEKEESRFMQMIEDVPQVISSVKPKNGFKIEMWNEETAEKLNRLLVSCVPITFGILDSTFTGYRNQTGATFFELKDESALAPYYIKLTDGVTYYYGTNEAVVGVSNNEIVLSTVWTSDIAGYTSPAVRDVIKALEVPELFEYQPFMTKAKNLYNTVDFCYWKIENGYIGFVVAGGSNPDNCYGYVATSVVLFSDIALIDTVTT